LLLTLLWLLSIVLGWSLLLLITLLLLLLTDSVRFHFLLL
jgi:hypothetical protein